MKVEFSNSRLNSGKKKLFFFRKLLKKKKSRSLIKEISVINISSTSQVDQIISVWEMCTPDEKI